LIIKSKRNKLKLQSKTGEVDSRQTLRVACGVGTPLKTEVSEGSGDEDIIIYLISDPLNIDSKMVTIIKRSVPEPEKTRIYDCLYKYNPLPL
jgi:hypothetical protein